MLSKQEARSYQAHFIVLVAFEDGSRVLGLDLFSLEYAWASFLFNKQHDAALCMLFAVINLGLILVVISRIHVGCPCVSMNFDNMSLLLSGLNIAPTILFLIVRYGMSRVVKYDRRSLSHRKIT